MRRRLALALACSLNVIPVMATAQTFTDITWALLAIDGTLTDSRATLRIDTDNVLAGAAPCNRWSANNGAALPDLDLAHIRSTRMACDKLAEEQAFFDALILMKTVRLDGNGTLVLSGADGRRMEFVPDGTDGLPVCTTCPPAK